MPFPGTPVGDWSGQEPPEDTRRHHHLVAKTSDTEGRSRERVRSLGLGKLPMKGTDDLRNEAS